MLLTSMPDELMEISSPKEIAMNKAGATREEAYKAIVRGLTSKKMTVDKFGYEHFEEDTTNQLRSAEMISRMNGDLKPDVLVDNRKATINLNGKPEEILELIRVVTAVNQELSELKMSGRQTGRIIDTTATARE